MTLIPSSTTLSPTVYGALASALGNRALLSRAGVGPRTAHTLRPYLVDAYRSGGGCRLSALLERNSRARMGVASLVRLLGLQPGGTAAARSPVKTPSRLLVLEGVGSLRVSRTATSVNLEFTGTGKDVQIDLIGRGRSVEPGWMQVQNSSVGTAARPGNVHSRTLRRGRGVPVLLQISQDTDARSCAHITTVCIGPDGIPYVHSSGPQFWNKAKVGSLEIERNYYGGRESLVLEHRGLGTGELISSISVNGLPVTLEASYRSVSDTAEILVLGTEIHLPFGQDALVDIVFKGGRRHHIVLEPNATLNPGMPRFVRDYVDRHVREAVLVDLSRITARGVTVPVRAIWSVLQITV